jgi:hypothetical protein
MCDCTALSAVARKNDNTDLVFSNERGCSGEAEGSRGSIVGGAIVDDEDFPVIGGIRGM